jgi:hypothetical protein
VYIDRCIYKLTPTAVLASVLCVCVCLFVCVLCLSLSLLCVSFFSCENVSKLSPKFLPSKLQPAHRPIKLLVFLHLHPNLESFLDCSYLFLFLRICLSSTSCCLIHDKIARLNWFLVFGFWVLFH